MLAIGVGAAAGLLIDHAGCHRPHAPASAVRVPGASPFATQRLAVPALLALPARRRGARAILARGARAEAAAGRRGRGQCAARRPHVRARQPRHLRPDDLSNGFGASVGLEAAYAQLARRWASVAGVALKLRRARPAHPGRGRRGRGDRRGVRRAADRRLLRLRDRHRRLYAVGDRAGRGRRAGRRRWSRRRSACSPMSINVVADARSPRRTIICSMRCSARSAPAIGIVLMRRWRWSSRRCGACRLPGLGAAGGRRRCC